MLNFCTVRFLSDKMKNEEWSYFSRNRTIINLILYAPLMNPFITGWNGESYWIVNDFKLRFCQDVTNFKSFHKFIRPYFEEIINWPDHIFSSIFLGKKVGFFKVFLVSGKRVINYNKMRRAHGTGSISVWIYLKVSQGRNVCLGRGGQVSASYMLFC